jgi:hypothetical protein
VLETSPCYRKFTRTHVVEALLVRRGDGEDDEWKLFWHQASKSSEVSTEFVRVRQTPGSAPAFPPQRWVVGIPIEVLAVFGEILAEERRARCCDKR